MQGTRGAEEDKGSWCWGEAAWLRWRESNLKGKRHISLRHEREGGVRKCLEMNAVCQQPPTLSLLAGDSQRVSLLLFWLPVMQVFNLRWANTFSLTRISAHLGTGRKWVAQSRFPSKEVQDWCKNPGEQHSVTMCWDYNSAQKLLVLEIQLPHSHSSCSEKFLWSPLCIPGNIPGRECCVILREKARVSKGPGLLFMSWIYHSFSGNKYVEIQLDVSLLTSIC